MSGEWDRSLSDDLAWLVRFAREQGLEEVEVAEEHRTLRIRRSADSIAPPAAGRAEPAGATDAAGDVGVLALRAEHVGIFHRAAADAETPLAEAGAHIDESQTIGVIDVLGVAHEIAVPAAGRLESFEVMDGQPIEFGQTLARLVPDNGVS